MGRMRAQKPTVNKTTHSSKNKPEKSFSKFLLTPTPDWYSSIPPLTPLTNDTPSPTPQQLSSLVDKASTLHSKDVSAYTSSSASTSSAADAKFLQNVLQSGTLSDRLSALTLMVQASPLHNVKALESLKNMAERGKGRGGREESLKAIRCIVDWWVGGGAPDRKLKYFRDQPLLHPNVTDLHLLLWHFEDWLKKFFFTVLQILETLSLDPLPYVRTQSLSLISTLLRDKPEQEQNLLHLLVNKLGDTEKSVCSRVSYHLLHLLQSHPSMKSIVVRGIISLVLKPSSSSAAASAQQNTKIVFSDSKPSAKAKNEPSKKGSASNPHARYYATITFNQIVLSPSAVDTKVAKELIDVYFELFKEMLGEGKVDEEEMQVVEKDGKKVHRDNKKTRKEIKGEAGFTEVEDSNSKLISAILTGVNRALPFAKMDLSDTRFNKHIDTLFLITHKSTFNISLQALLLILQISISISSSSSLSNTITDRYYRTLYTSLFDPRLATSSKQAMYLNLLFKSLKADKNVERVKAFVRRFVQVLAAGAVVGGGVEFIVGGLYLLGELFSTLPGLREMLQRKNADAEESPYDPRKRDPKYANAASSPLYELLPLTTHYHPTVSLNTTQLFYSLPLTSSPDLSLNTLSHFLDRFVYKNPKSKVKPKGSSAMQPAASVAAADGSVKLVKGEVGVGESGKGGERTVNDEGWWKRRVEDVPVDQLFFHKFFNEKNAREKDKAKKVQKRKKDDDSGVQDDDDEMEGSEDDEAEAEIWTAMKASMPDLDVDEDSDNLPSVDDDEGDGEVEEPSISDEDDEGHFSLAEDSDADDLIPMDEFPRGLLDYSPGSQSASEAEADPESDADEAEDEWEGIGATGTKRKRSSQNTKKQSGKKSKRLRGLATFASYEDYAEMIEGGLEDDI